MKKRILTVILVCMMILGAVTALPLSAEAAGENLPGMSTVSISWDDVSANLRWGAELFSQPSGVYNADLALVSIALEKTAHDPSPYLVEKFTNIFGFETCQLYEPSSQLPPFVIAHRTMRVNGEDCAVIAAVLRGTVSAAEWISNLNIARTQYYGYSVHAGFKSYADEVWKALNAFLSENTGLPAKKKLLVTGFSSGGSAANLLGIRFTKDTNQSIAQRDDVYVYGFATPNTYTGSPANPADCSNIFNIVCNEDMVPKMPSGSVLTTWRKFGRILTFSSGANVTHDQIVYLQGIPNAKFTQEAPTLTFSGFFEWIFSMLRNLFRFQF